MKHLKDFSFYLKESSGKEFEFSVFNIFRPFGRLISNINVNYKMRNLINSYDEYLYYVYLEYLNRKTNISIAELDNSDVRVVNQENKIRVKEFGEDDLSNDTDLIAKPSEDSTSGAVTAPIATEPEKYSAKKVMNTDSPFIDEIEQNYFAEMVDELVEGGNLYQLRQLRNEYSDALKKDNQRLQIAKKDMNNINKLKKKATEDILGIDKNSPNHATEYAKLDSKINVYNTELGKISDRTSKLINRVGQHKWFLEEIGKAIRFVERKKKEEREKEELNKGSETTPTTAPEVSNDDEIELREVSEANEWLGGGVIDWSWTNIDMKKINDLINPFHIEEFYLKADIVINASKNPEKAKTQWNLYLNSLYKKWYYTFDVRNLRNLSPNISNNKTNKDDLVVKEELAYSTLILEEIFHNLKSYSYRFKGLKTDKNKYFILLSKNSLFLMKKIMFNGDREQYSFQLLSTLKPNKENNNFVIPKLFNGLNDSFEMRINDKEVSMYKEKRNYPVFYIYDGNMYVSEDFINWNTISLKNCNIYSLKDVHFKQIVKNSGISYDDILPSEEIFDKIKKTKL